MSLSTGGAVAAAVGLLVVGAVAGALVVVAVGFLAPAPLLSLQVGADGDVATLDLAPGDCGAACCQPCGHSGCGTAQPYTP